MYRTVDHLFPAWVKVAQSGWRDAVAAEWLNATFCNRLSRGACVLYYIILSKKVMLAWVLLTL